jgi:hypothetical protein
VLKKWEALNAGGKNAKKRAVVAVARKLAVLLHRLWVTGAVYEPLRMAERCQAAAPALAAPSRWHAWDLAEVDVGQIVGVWTP